MSKELDPEAEKELAKLKGRFLKDRKDAEEKANSETPEKTEDIDPELSQLEFDRMTGPIGVEVSEEEWTSIKINELKSKALDNK